MNDPRLEERFLKVFRAAALQAGVVARVLQGEVQAKVKEGPNRTPESSALSAVDLATQEILLLRLAEELPEVSVDAEEDTETVGRFPPAEGGRPLVVIDPVDGSLNYLRGSEEFAVMGGLLVEGVYRAAVMYFPRWKTTLFARKGGGCFEQRDGGPERRVLIREVPQRILVSPWTPEPLHARMRALGFEVAVSRCSAVESAAPALGRAAAAVDTGKLGRRRSLGFLLSEEAGGAVVVGPHAWSGKDPAGTSPGANIVAQTPELARQLLDIVASG